MLQEDFTCFWRSFMNDASMVGCPSRTFREGLFRLEVTPSRPEVKLRSGFLHFSNANASAGQEKWVQDRHGFDQVGTVGFSAKWERHGIINNGHGFPLALIQDRLSRAFVFPTHSSSSR
jgi:hypothetical protein